MPSHDYTQVQCHCHLLTGHQESKPKNAIQTSVSRRINPKIKELYLILLSVFKIKWVSYSNCLPSLGFKILHCTWCCLSNNSKRDERNKPMWQLALLIHG